MNQTKAGAPSAKRQGGHASTFPPALPALTSVRALLALGVVLFHYHFMWPLDDMAYTGLISRSRLAVDVFFMLSGFVLTHAYSRGLETGSFRYVDFLVARVARIFPLHLAILAGVIGIVLIARLVGAPFDARNYNGPGLAATALLVHAWFPPGLIAEWNGPSWSLSAEWFAYLLFPAYGWIGIKLRNRPLVLLTLACAGFAGLDTAYRAAFGVPLAHAEANLGILRIAPEFLAGVGLYRLGERLAVTPRRATILTAATALLMVTLMHLMADERAIIAAAALLVLGLALLSKAGADEGLSKPWMLLAGEASFALYLVHFPALIIWKGAMEALTGRSSAYVMAWWEIGVLLPVTIAAALALHLAVEVPARRWLRRRGGRKDRAGAISTAGTQPPDL